MTWFGSLQNRETVQLENAIRRVPNVISELHTEASHNRPTGSEYYTRLVVDDYLRALSAFIAQLNERLTILENKKGR